MSQVANKPKDGSSRSLKEDLESALPSSYRCKAHYVHTLPKACDPLFSPPPDQELEKTRLATHFLTISTRAGVDDSSNAKTKTTDDAEGILGLAMEVMVYTTRRMTTIFVSKADSTGFITKAKPSPVKCVATAFLRWLTEQERQEHPSRKVVVSLFARAQSQYLFPGSAEHSKKHVLDDRQLIKWWARVLDPLFPAVSGKETSSTDDAHYQGYLTVPGYQGQREITQFSPLSDRSATGDVRWKAGNPLPELAEARGVSPDAPPRCLLPRFPDDPKARYMQDLDDEAGIVDDLQHFSSPSKRKRGGQWSGLRDLERFWEAMEFRQECSSGRVVGFLWLVISSKGIPTSEPNSQVTTGSQIPGSSQVSTTEAEGLESSQGMRKTPASRTRSPRKPSRKKLTGPIMARQPRLKMSSSSNLSAMVEPDSQAGSGQGEGLMLTKEGYDKAMQTMLHLDFANAEIAAVSSRKWVANVASLCGVRGDWGIDVEGKAALQEADIGATKSGEPVVNNLSGMVKRKRKIAEPVKSDGKQEIAVAPESGVNVLAGSMIRKKEKATKE
ncbi:hypothetical protein MBLNU230_g0526t1 [Neophaeotheca triangularis]